MIFLKNIVYHPTNMSDIAIEKISQITKALEEAKQIGLDISCFENLVEHLRQQQIIELSDDKDDEEL